MTRSDGHGKLGELRISISVTVIAVLLLALVTVIFYWLTKDLKQTAIFLVAAAAASGSTLGAFYSARALRLTADSQRKALAFQFTSKWNDPQLFHVRDAIKTLFDLDPRDAAFEALVDEKKTNVIHFLNLMEEIGVAIEFAGADEDILKAAYQGVVLKAWEKLQHWIRDTRTSYGQLDLWIKFEQLAIKWRRN
jgi:hypothetical protein